jgi:MFS family permease
VPILFGVVLLDLIGFGIVIPILPFLSPQLGATKMDIAYIVMTYAIGAGISGPLWGRLSDRVGRKPIIMVCLLGAALSYVMLGLADELWMIYAARGFAGLMAGNLGVASAMMADITPPKDRARGMGLIGAAFGLGMVLGPMIGGLLSGGDGSFTLPCLFAGVMSVLAMVTAALLLPESLSAEKRAANRADQGSGSRPSLYRVLRESGNRLILLQYVIHTICVSSVTYLFPLWMGDVLGWGAREVGIVFGVQGAIMVVVQGGLMGVLVRKVGELRLLCLAITAFFSGLLSAVFADTMAVMIGSMYLAMTGATLCMPLLNTIVSHRTPAPHRGRILGTTSSAAAWGRVFGPFLAGTNLAAFGYSGAWFFCAVMLLFYLAWALREYALDRTASGLPAGRQLQ